MPDLSSLIAPLSKQEFLSKGFPDRFLASRGAPTRFADLLAIPELDDLELFIGSQTSPVRVWGSSPQLSAVVPASEASRFYQAGMTLYFRDVEKGVPALSPILRRLEEELQVPSETCSCEAFAARAGSDVLMHFDSDYAFNLQLRGRKRWRVAPNQHVINPSIGAKPGGRVPVELLREQRLRTALPARMPKGSKSYDVGPGSVVWLPRGDWHETKILGDEDSFCLIFAVRPKMWMDHLLGVIRRRLIAQEAWRGSAFGLNGTREAWNAARDHAAALLHRLPEDLLGLSAEELLCHQLPIYLDDPWRFEPVSQVTIPTQKRSSSRIVKVKKRGQILELEVETATIAELVLWALSRKDPFSGRDARCKVPALPAEELAGGLRLLVDAGLMRRFLPQLPVTNGARSSHLRVG